MDNKKKKRSISSKSQQNKKVKKSSVKKRSISSKSQQNKKVKKSSVDADSLGAKDFEYEFLDMKLLSEGQLVLGCVARVEECRVILSLPGCISATVEANYVSNEFTELVKNNDQLSSQLPTLSSILQPGMTLPCKLLKIDRDISNKMKIFASIKPDDVYASLNPASLHLKMVLYVSICSIEDHGYVVSVGVDQVKAFLPKHNCCSESLQIGQIVPTSIKQLYHDKNAAVIQVTELDFNEEFPNVSTEVTHLHSILPGTKITADIIEIKDQFLRLKFNDFDACATIFSKSVSKNLDVGTAVEGTVLFVNLVSRVIHLALHSLPTPNQFTGLFPFKKFELVKKPKFLYFFRNRAFYKLSKATLGFVHTQDLPNAAEKSESVSLLSSEIDKARVLRFHYLDKLLQLSAKQSFVDEKLVLPEDVRIGDVYNVKVQRHVENGMFVKISLGCYGFVRRIFMSDAYVTKPDVLYPSELDVKCKVLSTDGHGRINLTAKKSLLNLDESLMLSSYEMARKGECYKGVIVKKSPAFIIVLFFNEVKGIVYKDEIPESSIFFEGQTVLCQVLWVNSAKKHLRLSLKVQSFPGQYLSCTEAKDKKMISSSQGKNNSAKENLLDGSSVKKLEKLNENASNPNLNTALIQKVKGHQLNIIMKMQKGRVHVTNLGCNIEGIYPLKEFRARQKISVYVVGQYLKKKKNYLEITHQNWSTFKECALTPTPAPVISDLKVGDTVMGFVKEASDISAKIWLSPTKFGILEYLHLSENPKIARRLSSRLKAGLSLKVQIWKILSDSDVEKRCNILLTVIADKKLEVGSNILGLVQVTCLERGLFLKLPFGYHGDVCVTDLSDVYTPVSAQLQKYLKLKFVLCHVLDVNHESKYCQLSLRKSRLFQKVAKNPNFCLELDASTLEVGNSVMGLVTTSSNTVISVMIGRNLEGTVSLHTCSIPKCLACILSKNILKKYSAGSVINVIIERIIDGTTYLFTLPELKKIDSKKCSRLPVNEDVVWEEMDR